MKNKKFLTALVAIALVFSLVLGLGIVNTPKAYADADPLPDIQNAVVTDGVLRWDSFAADCWYQWRLEDQYGLVHDTGDPNARVVNLVNEAKLIHLESGLHTWTLQAVEYDELEGEVGDGLSRVTSGAFSYTLDQERYDAPTNLTWTNTTISWDATTNTGGYHWYLYEVGRDTYLTHGYTSTAITSNTFTTSGWFEAGKTYYFEVQALAQANGDIEHMHSLKARSVNKTYDVVATINNVKIDEDNLLTFDPIDVEGVKYYIDFYTGAGSHNLYVPSITTLPIDLEWVFDDYHFSKTTPFTLEILAYDGATNVPLTAMYRINNWTYGDTYVQPVAQTTNGGLSAGAIVAIVLAVVIVGGCSGFAIYWFVVKKKTWADFVALFKKK